MCFNPMGSTMLLSEEQPENALYPTPVTPLGILMLSNERQCSNAPCSMFINPSGRTTSVRDEQSMNALDLMNFMPFGITMLLSEVTSAPKQEESQLSLDSTLIFVREVCSQPSVSLGSISEDATNSGSKISIPLQVPESSKKQNLNFLGTGKYLHRFYVVFTTAFTFSSGPDPREPLEAHG